MGTAELPSEDPLHSGIYGREMISGMQTTDPAGHPKMLAYLLRKNVYVRPLRLKLGGRRVLSANLNVETARSQRKRPEIRSSACLETVFAIF